MLWLAFGLLTLIAVAAVLAPLARQPAAAPDTTQDAKAFYDKQIAEIDRDATAGLLSQADVEGAKAEAARRLLAAGRIAVPQARAASRVPLIVAALFVPLAAAGLYARYGNPKLPDEPLAARIGEKPADVEDAVVRVEKHLAQNPQDGRGWAVLAPVYMRLERYPDAVRAFGQSLRLNGESAPRYADYAEALIYASNGLVTADARKNFDRALALDAKNAKARYYLGLAAEQDGDKAKAKELWGRLADEAPGTPFAQNMRERIAALDGKKPDAAAIAGMNATDRQAAIRTMVAGLDQRLHQQGGSPEEWTRLIRAYSVLQEKDKARAALADARKALGESAKAPLDAIAQELGIEG
ncbi:MAG: c-type cytochrome biogenesis protein CcmI [Hyphomicrobiales bacterium]|nr:c-type cytochrome biogenesis protein CcmI [Hyphomicrobiales bacterium]